MMGTLPAKEAQPVRSERVCTTPAVAPAGLHLSLRAPLPVDLLLEHEFRGVPFDRYRRRPCVTYSDTGRKGHRPVSCHGITTRGRRLLDPGRRRLCRCLRLGLLPGVQLSVVTREEPAALRLAATSALAIARGSLPGRGLPCGLLCCHSSLLPLRHVGCLGLIDGLPGGCPDGVRLLVLQLALLLRSETSRRSCHWVLPAFLYFCGSKEPAVPAVAVTGAPDPVPEVRVLEEDTTVVGTKQPPTPISPRHQ